MRAASLPWDQTRSLVNAVRIFRRESTVDYGRYRFAYTEHAEVAPGEPLESVYAQGFLPASHDPAERRLGFYRARSLRLDLGTYAFEKKRRYLQRKGTEAGLRWEAMPLETFTAQAPTDWKARVLGWIADRHEVPFMDTNRLERILGMPFLREVAVVHAGTEWVGLVLLPGDTTWAHYWFCLYDPAWQPARSLGKWILGETARALAEAGRAHLYLGTAYGRKSAYKHQGITAGVEFFDGDVWSGDLVELARRQDADPA